MLLGLTDQDIEDLETVLADSEAVSLHDVFEAGLMALLDGKPDKRL